MTELLPLISRLSDAGVEFIIVDGVAGALHGAAVQRKISMSFIGDHQKTSFGPFARWTSSIHTLVAPQTDFHFDGTNAL